MKRLLNIFIAVAAIFAVVSCDTEDKSRKDALLSPGRLYLPRDQYPLDITTGQSVVFEWENSVTDNVKIGRASCRERV